MNSIAQRVILCALNEDTHFINDNILDRMPSVVKEYKSHDEAVSESAEDAHVPTEFLNRLTPTGMPPHVLRLKVGCIVMLLRNLNMNMGLCNGTRLIVTHLHQNIIECRRFNHPDDEPPILIPRICVIASKGKYPFDLKRRQFPLRLAFSVTINKSQGQTFDKVGLYLRMPVFGHGQFYVACSRVRNPNDLIILNQGQLNKTKNIVYTELLS